MDLQEGKPTNEEVNPQGAEDVQQKAEKQDEVIKETPDSAEAQAPAEAGTTSVDEGAETVEAPIAEEQAQTETSEVSADPVVQSAEDTETTEPQADEADTAAEAEVPEENASESSSVEQTADSEVAEGTEEKPSVEAESAETPAEESAEVLTTDTATPDQTGNQAETTDASDTPASEPPVKEKEVEEELEDIDFSAQTKEELLEFAKDLNNHDQVRRLDKYLKPLKARFDQLFIQERQKALDAFVADGNERDDFEFKGDEDTRKFQDYYDLLREKRGKAHAEQEKQREDNLKKKEEILEKIRELIDGEETDVSIKAVKELQNEWKTVGPVPGQHNKTLWANYNALLDRFYDARSIYFELKDLDRKKNLKQKLELCEKAEALDALESVKEAVTQLNDLHEEFKHVGPIPREHQEDVWQRFKAASDRIYVKRKGFVEDLKKAFVENLDKKLKFVEEAEQFTQFDSDRISAWNKKTKEIQELQSRWEAVGGIPREKAKQVNKRFWAAFKHFFANKSAFFKKFEAQRGENLKLKQGLVEEAKALQESKDWVSTTDKYKRLQARWKEIGPVPEKFRTSIYEEFKAACDHFFDQRRAQNQEQNQEQEANLQVKLKVCDSLEAMSAEETLDLDVAYGLLDQFHEAGFVPRNAMKKIQNRFAEVTLKLLNASSLSDEDRQDMKINIEVGKIKGGPHSDRKMFRKENSLKRKIDNLESDISTWRNNMEFFASSKAADQLKKDFEAKIDKASEELKELRRELRMLHNS